jgi:hypothetical protein
MSESSTSTRRTRSATRRKTPASEQESVESAAPGPPPSPTPTGQPKRVRAGPTARLSPVPEKDTKTKKGRRRGVSQKPDPILEQLFTAHPSLRSILGGQDLSSAAIERLSTLQGLVEVVEHLGSDPFIPFLAIGALLESDARVSAAVEARQDPSLPGNSFRDVIWSKGEQEQWMNPNFPLQKVPLPSMPPFPSPSPYETLQTSTSAIESSGKSEIEKAGKIAVVVPSDSANHSSARDPATSEAHETTEMVGDRSVEVRQAMEGGVVSEGEGDGERKANNKEKVAGDGIDEQVEGKKTVSALAEAVPQLVCHPLV